MATNPVEENPVTRFLVGLAVIAGMFVGGGAVGSLVADVDVPYSTEVGVFVGALAVFLAFAWWYTRYATDARES